MQTANAQAAANAETARVQARLNRVNQTTPFGTQTFTDLGNDRWSSDITLSPEQQRLYNSQTATGQGLYDLANAALPRLNTAMSSQINTSGLPDPVAMQGDVAARSREVGQNLYDAGIARLQPQFDRARGQTEQMLADRGIGAGSGDAWSNTWRDQGQIQNDALLQLNSQAQQAAGAEQNRLTNLAQAIRQGAIQEQDYFRQQPLNDVAKLLGTSPGVTTPQFSQVAQVGVAPTDVIGPINTQYQGSLANWNAQNQRSNQEMGGLFSLGGTALGAGLRYGLPLLLGSDRRLKRDIRRVGKLENGLPVYLFRYKAGGPMQIGLMADDVERIHPEAVHVIDGFKAVNYAEAVA